MHEGLLQQFDAAQDRLHERGEATLGELNTLLRRDGRVKAHSVTLRVKSRQSLSAKLLRPDRTYDSLWSVTDLVGLRVIVYFDDDVDRVGQIIESNLSVDFAHSIDKRRLDASTFGYRSLHYVCPLDPVDERANASATADPVARCEIQIRTVLEHAWAEIEHDLGYKSASAAPSHVQRRLNRIAGLLELADQEFGSIRCDLRDYARALPERIAADGDSVLLDRLSLRLLLDCAEVRALDREIAAALGKRLGSEPFFPDYLLKMLATSGIRSVGEAREGIARHSARITAMVRPYFAFAWEAWQLSPARMDTIFIGYSLFFLAHAEAISTTALGVGKVDRLARLYRVLDYPQDEHAALRVAGRLVEAFGDLGVPRAADRRGED